jgi:ribosome-binding factor A
VPENAAAIDDLLREARERDAETERLAATAAYAGDADPYVKPRDLDEDDDEDDADDEDDEPEADATDAR